MDWGRRLTLTIVVGMFAVFGYQVFSAYQHSRTPAGWTVGDVFWFDWVRFAAKTDLEIQSYLEHRWPDDTADLETHCEWDLPSAEADHKLANQLSNPPREIADDLTRSMRSFAAYSSSLCELLWVAELPDDQRALQEPTMMEQIETHRSESFAAAHRASIVLIEATDDLEPSWWSRHGSELDKLAVTAERTLVALDSALASTLVDELGPRDRACAAWLEHDNQLAIEQMRLAWTTAPRLLESMGEGTFEHAVSTLGQMCAASGSTVTAFGTARPLADVHEGWATIVRSNFATLDIFRP